MVRRDPHLIGSQGGQEMSRHDTRREKVNNTVLHADSTRSATVVCTRHTSCRRMVGAIHKSNQKKDRLMSCRNSHSSSRVENLVRSSREGAEPRKCWVPRRRATAGGGCWRRVAGPLGALGSVAATVGVCGVRLLGCISLYDGVQTQRFVLYECVF